MNPICAWLRYKQMPKTYQITEIAPDVRTSIHELPSKISTMVYMAVNRSHKGMITTRFLFNYDKCLFLQKFIYQEYLRFLQENCHFHALKLQIINSL